MVCLMYVLHGDSGTLNKFTTCRGALNYKNDDDYDDDYWWGQ